MVGTLGRNFTVFTHYNKQRLHIMKQLAPPGRYELLSAIPLLFHVNNVRAPGYVAELGPNPGVYGFKLTDDIRNLRKEFISKNFLTSVGTVDEPLVLSIASIGSAGTVAQTDKSDFDLWIIAKDTITEREWKLLEKKGKAIKQFLVSQDEHIDVNFYLGTPERIRNHNFGAVSDDSAGSALGKLLKEEFYRTCVVWGGKIPFWWMCPEEVNTPEGYRAWWGAFEPLRVPFKDDLMDLGPLERGTLSQFLAAVLWQTNKSLASPFKSLLKLAVVNTYAENMKAELLAEQVRRNVHVNPTHGDSTDPYLCLFTYAANALLQKQDKQGERLLAEMFFLKTIGSDDSFRVTVQTLDATINRKRAEVRDWIRRYGLGKDDMRDLENINNWGFKRGLEYRAIVQAFVKRVYDRVMVYLHRLGITLDRGVIRLLREEVDRDAVTLLQEFSTISEKVDCFYGMAIPKVQPVPSSFRKMLHQSAYALIFDPNAASDKRWAIQEEVPLGVKSALKYLPEQGTEEAEAMLKKAKSTRMMSRAEMEKHIREGTVASTNAAPVPEEEDPLEQELYEEAMQQQLLVSGRSVINLIVWLALNKLTNIRTMYRVKIGPKNRPVRELRSLMLLFKNNFGHALYEDGMPESAFKDPPKPLRAFLSFDFAQHSHFREDQDADKVTERDTKEADGSGGLERMTYAIQDTYGICRVRTVDARRYTPGSMMARILRDFRDIKTSDLGSYVFLHAADTREHEAFLKDFTAVLYRVHETFRKMPERKGLGVRYVTKVRDSYIVITRGLNGNITGISPGPMRELLKYLEKPIGGMVQTVVDPEIYGAERLREMVRLWMPGQVQIFVKRGSPTSSIHIVDEAGNFLNDRVENGVLDMGLKSMTVFLNSLGQSPLTFAANRDGKLKFALQEIVNISNVDSKFEYRLARYGAGDTMVMRKNLFLSLAGPLDLRLPHRVVIRTPGNMEEHETKGDNFLVELARVVGDAMSRLSCDDFSIIELKQTIGPPRCRQTIEYLSLRRSIDRGLRRLLLSQGKSQVSQPKNVVGSTTLHVTRQDTPEDVARAEEERRGVVVERTREATDSQLEVGDADAMDRSDGLESPSHERGSDENGSNESTNGAHANDESEYGNYVDVTPSVDDAPRAPYLEG